VTPPLVPQRSASRRAQRALGRAAGVARELIGHDDEDDAHNDRAYRIRRDERPPDAVVRIAGGRLDDALEQLRERLEDDPAAAIHEARKDLKKARSLLRLVRDRIGEEAYRRESDRLRDAGRMLSGSRDAQAKAETLEALAERFGDELPAGVEGWRADLERERDSVTADLDDRDSELRAAVRDAIEAIAASRDSVEDWAPSKRGWKLLAPGLERSYGRGRDRFRDVRRDPSAESIHEWRKRVKDLWYDLRLLRDSWPGVLGQTADQAHDLSDLLGDHHDLTVLAEDVHGRPAFADDGDDLAAITSAIESRQEELLEAAVPVGERLYAEAPDAFVKRMRAYWKAWRPG
jgi:CHAD domain-containing protein